MVEPLNDDEIKRVLVVNAHPDDSDFGASGTIATWVKKGIVVSYVMCTNGDQGGEASGIAASDMAATRQREQRAAGEAIGVTDITFLNYRDGWLEPTIALRKDIVRQIRISQPDRMVIQSPERNWERIGASHPDHLAAGEAAIQAVYPDARNPFAFTDILEEGHQPWRVKEVWLMAHATPDHWVDITETFPLKYFFSTWLFSSINTRSVSSGGIFLKLKLKCMLNLQKFRLFFFFFLMQEGSAYPCILPQSALRCLFFLVSGVPLFFDQKEGFLDFLFESFF
jgi:LmbE family N-acetylglucosaminyl deacetylase